MPKIIVREARESDAKPIAGLLARRHTRDSARLPHLDPKLSAPDAWQPVIEGMLTNPRTDGAVAEAGGQPVGFMFGERMLLAPNDFASQYIPPHSISIGVDAHAAEGAPALDIYRALYAELAVAWVAEGFFVHRANIPAGDPELQDAWVTLGFGRYLTAATRDTRTSVTLERPRNLTVERASPEDIEEVMRLADDLNEWHWRSPIFWPIVQSAQPAARQFNAGALRSADIPYFVAYEGGNAVAMQTFLRPGFTPPIVKQDTDVYLFEGVVANAARGGGIGGTLLSECLEWASRSGYSSCTLHFAPANPSGAPFWLGHGFVPVEHTMERTIDSRIAWARPPGV